MREERGANLLLLPRCSSYANQRWRTHEQDFHPQPVPNGPKLRRRLQEVGDTSLATVVSPNEPGRVFTQFLQVHRCRPLVDSTDGKVEDHRALQHRQAGAAATAEEAPGHRRRSAARASGGTGVTPSGATGTPSRCGQASGGTRASAHCGKTHRPRM
jgi:hypothetical protein